MRNHKVLILFYILVFFQNINGNAQSFDTILVATIHYANNQSNLTVEQKNTIYNVYASTIDCKKIIIKSYSDTKGSKEYNLYLSLQRGNKVKKQLDSLYHKKINSINSGMGIDYSDFQNDLKRRSEIYIIKETRKQAVTSTGMLDTIMDKTRNQIKQNELIIEQKILSKIDSVIPNKKIIVHETYNDSLALSEKYEEVADSLITEQFGYKILQSKLNIKFEVPYRKDSSYMNLRIEEFVNQKSTFEKNLTTMTSDGVLQSYYMFETKSNNAHKKEKVKVQLPKKLFQQDENMRLYKWNKIKNVWEFEMFINLSNFDISCDCFKFDIGIGTYNFDSPVKCPTELVVNFDAKAPLPKRNLLGMKKYLYVRPKFIFVTDNAVTLIKCKKTSKTKAKFGKIPEVKGKIIGIVKLYDGKYYSEESVDITQLKSVSGIKVFNSTNKYVKKVPDCLLNKGYVTSYFSSMIK